MAESAFCPLSPPHKGSHLQEPPGASEQEECSDAPRVSWGRSSTEMHGAEMHSVSEQEMVFMLCK